MRQRDCEVRYEACHEYGPQAVQGRRCDFRFWREEREIYLIHSGSVEIVSREGLVLATLNAGELFGEMASIMGERERTARAVTASTAVMM